MPLDNEFGALATTGNVSCQVDPIGITHHLAMLNWTKADDHKILANMKICGSVGENSPNVPYRKSKYVVFL